MNEVDAAFATTLSGDSAMTALATGGFHNGKAPQGTPPPYGVFAKLPTGREDTYTMGRLAFRRLRYVVKAVVEGPSKDVANQIRARADALLTDQAIAIAGHTLMRLRRVGDVDYPEEVLGGVTFLHVGHLFELEVAPA